MDLNQLRYFPLFRGGLGGCIIVAIIHNPSIIAMLCIFGLIDHVWIKDWIKKQEALHGED